MIYRQNLLLGAVLLVLSEFLFASMGAAIKTVATTGISNEMTVFMRNLVGLLALAPLLLRGHRRMLHTQVGGLHLLRAASGVGAMYCFYYALAHLPLADGMLLKMTAPLFMPLIAWLWLAERLRLATAMAVLVGFVGVYLIVGPSGKANPIALLGLLGGGLAAVAKSTVRRLGRTEPNTRVVFYFALGGLLISSLPLTWAWQTPSAIQWQWLFAIGLLGTAGQLLLTRAYAIAPAGRVSPFTYFSVIFGISYGYLLWGEIPSATFITGSLLIAAAGLLTLQGPRAD